MLDVLMMKSHWYDFYYQTLYLRSKSRIHSRLSSKARRVLFKVMHIALSGNLFTIVEAAALHHLTSILSQVSVAPYKVDHPISNPPISADFMPIETAYSDDVDFCNTDLDTLKEMLPIAKDIFQHWDLYINPTQTEFVHFYLAEPKPAVKRKAVVGKVYRGDEQWR